MGEEGAHGKAYAFISHTVPTISRKLLKGSTDAMTSLPIDAVTPQILTALETGTRLVLAAPPGAGKSTRLPLQLLDAPWLEGKRILLLEPRRIAARMAAERMALTLGEKVGGVIGLSTRVDRRVSAATRLERCPRRSVDRRGRRGGIIHK